MMLLLLFLLSVLSYSYGDDIALKLLSLYPSEGVLENFQAITAIFNLPIFPLGADVGTDPSTLITPFFVYADNQQGTVPGKYYWVSSTIVRFDPAMKWPSDLSVRIVVNEKLTSYESSKSVCLAEDANSRFEYIFTTSPQKIFFDSIKNKKLEKLTKNRYSSIVRNKTLEKQYTSLSSLSSPSLSTPSLNTIFVYEVLPESIVQFSFSSPIQLPLMHIVFINFFDNQEIISDAVESFSLCSQSSANDANDFTPYKEYLLQNLTETAPASIACIKLKLRENVIPTNKFYYVSFAENEYYHAFAGRSRLYSLGRSSADALVTGPTPFELFGENIVISHDRARVFFNRALSPDISVPQFMSRVSFSPPLSSPCTASKIDNCEIELTCNFPLNSEYTLSIEQDEAIIDGIGFSLQSSTIPFTVSDFSPQIYLPNEKAVNVHDQDIKNTSFMTVFTHPSPSNSTYMPSPYYKSLSVRIVRVDSRNLATILQKVRSYNFNRETTRITGQVLAEKNCLQEFLATARKTPLLSSPLLFNISYPLLPETAPTRANSRSIIRGDSFATAFVEIKRDVCYVTSSSPSPRRETCYANNHSYLVSAVSFLSHGVLYSSNGRAQLFLHAVDIEDGSPVSNVSVSLIPLRSGEVMRTLAKTEANGVAVFDIDEALHQKLRQQSVNVVVERDTASHQELFSFPSNFQLYEAPETAADIAVQPNFKVSFATDRIVYKPGDTIAFTAFVAVETPEGENLIPNKFDAAGIYVLGVEWPFDVRGEVCFQAVFAINRETGAVAGDIKIPAAASYGVRNPPTVSIHQEGDVNENLIGKCSHRWQGKYRSQLYFNANDANNNIVIANPRTNSIILEQISMNDLWFKDQDLVISGVVTSNTGNPLSKHAVSVEVTLTGLSFDWRDEKDEDETAAEGNESAETVTIYSKKERTIKISPTKRFIKLFFDVFTDTDGKFDVKANIRDYKFDRPKYQKIFDEIFTKMRIGDGFTVAVQSLGLTGEAVKQEKDIKYSPSPYQLTSLSLSHISPFPTRPFAVRSTVSTIVPSPDFSADRDVSTKIYLIRLPANETANAETEEDGAITFIECKDRLKFAETGDFDETANDIVDSCSAKADGHCEFRLPSIGSFAVFAESSYPKFDAAKKKLDSKVSVKNSQCELVGKTHEEYLDNPIERISQENLTVEIKEDKLTGEITNPSIFDELHLIIIWSHGEVIKKTINFDGHVTANVTLSDLPSLPSSCVSDCRLTIIGYQILTNQNKEYVKNFLSNLPVSLQYSPEEPVEAFFSTTVRKESEEGSSANASCEVPSLLSETGSCVSKPETANIRISSFEVYHNDLLVSNLDDYFAPKMDNVKILVKISGASNANVAYRYVINDKSLFDIKNLPATNANKDLLQTRTLRSTSRNISYFFLNGIKRHLSHVSREEALLSTLLARLKLERLAYIDTYSLDIPIKKYLAGRYSYFTTAPNALSYLPARFGRNGILHNLAYRSTAGAPAPAMGLVPEMMMMDRSEGILAKRGERGEGNEGGEGGEGGEDRSSLLRQNFVQIFASGIEFCKTDANGDCEIEIELPTFPDNETTFLMRQYLTLVESDEKLMSYASGDRTLVSSQALSLLEKSPRTVRLFDVSDIGVLILANHQFLAKNRNRVCNLTLSLYLPSPVSAFRLLGEEESGVSRLESDNLMYSGDVDGANILLEGRDASLPSSTVSKSLVNQKKNLCIEQAATLFTWRLEGSQLGIGEIEVSLSQGEKLVDGILMKVPIQYAQPPIALLSSETVLLSKSATDRQFPVSFPLGLLPSYGDVAFAISRGHFSLLSSITKGYIKNSLTQFNGEGDPIKEADASPLLLLSVGVTHQILKEVYKFDAFSESETYWSERSLNSLANDFTDRGKFTEKYNLGLCNTACQQIYSRPTQNNGFTRPLPISPDVSLNVMGISSIFAVSPYVANETLRTTILDAKSIWETALLAYLRQKLERFERAYYEAHGKKDIPLRVLFSNLLEAHQLSVLLLMDENFTKKVDSRLTLANFLTTRDETVEADSIGDSYLWAVEIVRANIYNQIDDVFKRRLQKVRNNIRFQGTTLSISETPGDTNAVSSSLLSLLVNIFLLSYKYNQNIEQKQVDFDILSRLLQALLSPASSPTVSPLSPSYPSPFKYLSLLPQILLLDQLHPVVDQNTQITVTPSYLFNSVSTPLSTPSPLTPHSPLSLSSPWSSLSPLPSPTSPIAYLSLLFSTTPSPPSPLLLSLSLRTSYLPLLLPSYPTSRGLSVSLSLLSLVPSLQKCQSPLSSLPSSTLLCVSLSLLSPDDLSSPLRIQVLLPGGLEIDSPLNFSLLTQNDLPPFFAWLFPRCRPVAVKADALEIHCHAVRAGELRVSFPVRANVSGRYVFPSVRVDLLNDESVFGLSKPLFITVTPNEQ